MNMEVMPKLIGSWKLMAFHFQDSSGKMAYPFGKDAQGRLIYELNGRGRISSAISNAMGSI